MRIPVVNYFKRLDLFGSGVGFTFDGESSYRSVCGATLSLMVFALILLQLNEKWVLLVENGDTTHSDHTVHGANDALTEVGFEETNFNLAFGIVPTNFTTGNR